jgi:hypothetical protein
MQSGRYSLGTVLDGLTQLYNYWSYGTGILIFVVGSSNTTCTILFFLLCFVFFWVGKKNDNRLSHIELLIFLDWKGSGTLSRTLTGVRIRWSGSVLNVYGMREIMRKVVPVEEGKFWVLNPIFSNVAGH